VIDGRDLELAGKCLGGQQKQRQAVGPAGYGECKAISGADQRAEIGGEARDDGV